MNNNICLNCGQHWSAHNPATLTCPSNSNSGTSRWGTTSFRAPLSQGAGGGFAEQPNPLDLTMDRMELLEIKRAAWQVVMAEYENWVNDDNQVEDFDWEARATGDFEVAKRAWEAMK